MRFSYNPFTSQLDGYKSGDEAVVGSGYAHGITIDGGGSAITTGAKGYFRVPYDCTVVGWTILADQSGDIVVDVKKGTYAGFPTTASIAGTEKPTLSAAQKNQDTGLTTWTTALAADDVLEYVVDSAATVQRVTVLLHVQRT
ncbi:MAG: hypothetical protein EKK55_17435 [Rhodocyclaceae bacterium]|nr:MAG: hypothetical protein EKK55_17435 [Rhodocyclaceae bacterium]